jgi:hypothetical protein
MDRGWQRLDSSPADRNDHTQLELPRAWDPSTVHELCRMVRAKRPNLIFLMETKLRKNKMEMVRTKIGFDNLFIVESVGKSGGLALLWEDGCEVEVVGILTLLFTVAI